MRLNRFFLTYLCCVATLGCDGKSDSLGVVGETESDSGDSEGTLSAGTTSPSTTDPTEGPVECPPNSVFLEPPSCPIGGLPTIDEPGCYAVCDGGNGDCDEGTCVEVEYNPCPCPPDAEACCGACAAQGFFCLDDAAAACFDEGEGEAFQLGTSIGDEDAGVSDCTVLSVEPLELDCTGAIVGDVQVTINQGGGPLDLSQGTQVVLEYVFVGEAEWANQWLRIADAATGELIIAATMAETAMPPGRPGFWGDFTVEQVSGCPTISCGEDAGPGVTVAPVRFSTDGAEIELDVGNGGILGFYAADVRQSRIGACGPSIADQAGWLSISVIRF